MTKPFDPYHTWLGIRPEEQPPNHYRLLALQLFEDNADTIEHAADQRMAHLRTLQAGRHSNLCQKLLNEVAAAKVCLLNPERKTAYDATLRTPVQAAVAVQPLPTMATAAVGHPNVAAPAVRPYAGRRRQSSLGAALVLGGIAVAVALVLVLWAPWREASADKPAKEAAKAPSAKPTDEELHAKPITTIKPAEPSPPATATTTPEPELPTPPVAPAPPDTPPAPPADPPVTPPLPVEPPKAPADPPVEPSSPPTPPAKLAVPSTLEQQTVTAQIEEVYKVSQAKTTAEKVKLAQELSELARKPTQNVAERFMLRRKAMELAADGGDLSLAFAIIETIGGEYQIDVLTVKDSVLTKFAEKAGDPDRTKAAVQHALELVDEALREKRYELSQKAATVAVRAAQRTGTPPELRKQAVERRTKVQKLYEQWQHVEAAQKALATNAADPEANLVVGRWKCLVEGDWSAGVELLAKGSDETLKAAAAQEPAGGNEAADLLRRGDAWWDAAQAFAGEEKGAWLRRAAHWYQQLASKDASPLEQAKAAKRLDDIAAFQESLLPAEKPSEKTVAKKPGERTIFTPHDVMKLFGLAASQWKVDGDVLGSEGAINSDANYPITTKPRKLGALEYGLKMKARSTQTIYVVIDGHRYSYARGVRMMPFEGWDRRGGWRGDRGGNPWDRAMSERGTRIGVDGTNQSRRGEEVASPDDFCILAVTLKENTLKFLYQGKEEWSGQIAPPSRGTKHTLQLGFGSTESDLKIKELYLEGE